MKILITEAVELAFNAFFNVLGNDTYKEQYHSTHFNLIVVEYKRMEEDYYDDAINDRIEKYIDLI